MLVGYLQELFASKKRANPRYSLRSFARSLGIDHSTLAKLLKRTRKISAVQALKIVRKLDIDSAMKSTLLLGVIEGLPPSVSEVERFRFLESESEGMDHWEFYAVLSLLEVPGTKSDVRWIARRLQSTEARVALCLRGLEKSGCIQRKGARWVSISRELSNLPANATQKAWIKRAQQEYIQKGLEALEHRIDERDISGATLAVSLDKFPEAWRRIKEFRRSLSAYLGDGEKDSVARINIQLFRLDRG